MVSVTSSSTTVSPAGKPRAPHRADGVLPSKAAVRQRCGSKALDHGPTCEWAAFPRTLRLYKKREISPPEDPAGPAWEEGRTVASDDEPAITRRRVRHREPGRENLRRRPKDTSMARRGGYAACLAADHGEPLQREGRPGTVSQQMLGRPCLWTAGSPSFPWLLRLGRPPATLDRACPRFVFLLTGVAIGWWRTAACPRDGGHGRGPMAGGSTVASVADRSPPAFHESHRPEGFPGLSHHRSSLHEGRTERRACGVTAGDKIDGVRQWASGRRLSADRAGVYSRSEVGGGRVRRVVRADRVRP